MAESNFIDYVKIYCASGHGGAGSVHLHRAKYVPKGGPDGGDGGRGGHIILRANPQFWTLIHLKYKKFIKAENGEHGGAALCKGKQGKDIVLDVPVGTVVKDGETGEVLFDMMEPGEEKILCKGGRGGLGNNNFKSATQQTPRYAQPGEDGQEGWFVLELKVLADVGLVGFPNAGKSTLMNRLAGKKIAVTGNKPGVTKGQQWLKSNKDLEILDTPGILWPKFEDELVGLKLALTGAIKDQLLPMDEVTIFGLNYFKTYYPERLEERFKGIDLEEEAPEIIMEMTRKLGFREDYDRFYNLFVKEVRDGKLGRYTLDIVGVDTDGDN